MWWDTILSSWTPLQLCCSRNQGRFPGRYNDKLGTAIQTHECQGYDAANIVNIDDIEHDVRLDIDIDVTQSTLSAPDDGMVLTL